MSPAPSPPAPPPVWARPTLHALTGLGALALGVLPRWGALLCAGLGVVAGWVVFPLTIERWLRRPGEPYLGGLRTYPVAVLGLVVLLPPAEAAAAWGVLAFGDTAAAVVGRRLASPSVFGHPKATWAGSAAHVVVGTLAGWALSSAVGGLALWSGGLDVGPVPGPVRCALAAAAGAFVDLLRVPPDDNLPLATAAGAALALTRGAVGS